MTAMLDRVYPGASEALRLAARAQHIRRWEIPRATYPMDRPGYLRWRKELGRKHAEWAGEILARCGYDAEDVARVGSLLRKENLRKDAETQALEDVSRSSSSPTTLRISPGKHEPDKVVTILAKTLAKMSEHGKAAAGGLDLPPPGPGRARSGCRTSRRIMTSPTPETVAAVLVAHGDRGGATPNAALRAQAEAVRKLTGIDVRTGMLKGEPTIEQALADAAATDAPHIAVYPLFMADGYFVQKVRERVLAVGHAPEPEFLAPLGLDPHCPTFSCEKPQPWRPAGNSNPCNPASLSSATARSLAQHLQRRHARPRLAPPSPAASRVSRQHS